MNRKFSFTLIIFLIIIIIYTSIINIKTKAEPVENQEKKIYLTFDDGPSSIITKELLPILNKHNVKATFFVIGCKIDGNEDIIKQLYEEGHSIGVHTYSHKYNKIYSSEDVFLEEMNKSADKIETIIGVRPTALRFPWGSKNHLTSSLLIKLHNNNYKIYDWNLSISDGINSKLSPDVFFKEATRKSVNCNRIFLLMHCDDINHNTCKALPQIITYYRSQGYIFEPITNETAEYYFRVKK